MLSSDSTSDSVRDFETWTFEGDEDLVLAPALLPFILSNYEISQIYILKLGFMQNIIFYII